MKFDPKTTAVLTLDMQLGLAGFVPQAEAAFAPAAEVVKKARQAGIKVIHIGIGFEPGHPEISPKHRRFGMVKEKNLFVKGSDMSKIHPSLLQAGDLVIYKHRVGAFSGNELEMVLRAQGIDTIVIMGISTSGIVLSTIRYATDQDFHVVVVKDACVDPDAEVHKILTEKIFPAQGDIIVAADFQA